MLWTAVSVLIYELYCGNVCLDVGGLRNAILCVNVSEHLRRENEHLVEQVDMLSARLLQSSQMHQLTAMSQQSHR